MATLSAVTTPIINLPNSREQTPVREDSARREQTPITRSVTESLAQTDAETKKNYSQQQDVITSSKSDSSTIQTGNRRGNLLDLTV